MNKNICIVTATRAEWGLLAPIAKEIQLRESLSLHIVATGTHFIPNFGNTYREIINQGFEINDRVDIQLYPVSEAAISKTMSLTLSGFADLFSRSQFDLLVVLGDRYEMIAVCLAAMNAKIPIAHIHGGETSTGAIDEGIRHCMTKLAYFHFTSCEEYRNRVIQLGEHPDRVFATGAPGIDNILNMELLDIEMLGNKTGIPLVKKNYVVVSFYPATLDNDVGPAEQCIELFNAMAQFPQIVFLVTKSNADNGAEEINNVMDRYANNNDNIFIVESLGSLLYLSAMKHSLCVLGNSSSGIIEAPYFDIPTINVGNRQDGRIKSNTTIDCKPQTKDIVEALQQVISKKDASIINDNLYGDGTAAKKIVNIIEEKLSLGNIDLKKQFFDVFQGDNA